MTKLRRAPKRFGYPPGVLDVFAIVPAAPLDFDAFLDDGTLADHGEVTGLDFGRSGLRGCHFWLKPQEFRAYRDRNRRRRVARHDLPHATQAAINHYLES